MDLRKWISYLPPSVGHVVRMDHERLLKSGYMCVPTRRNRVYISVNRHFFLQQVAEDEELPTQKGHKLITSRCKLVAEGESHFSQLSNEPLNVLWDAGKPMQCQYLSRRTKSCSSGDAADCAKWTSNAHPGRRQDFFPASAHALLRGI